MFTILNFKDNLSLNTLSPHIFKNGTTTWANLTQWRLSIALRYPKGNVWKIIHYSIELSLIDLFLQTRLIHKGKESCISLLSHVLYLVGDWSINYTDLAPWKIWQLISSSWSHNWYVFYRPKIVFSGPIKMENEATN